MHEPMPEEKFQRIFATLQEHRDKGTYPGSVWLLATCWELLAELKITRMYDRRERKR